MIISHKHKYLFIEVPHTGTTAISEELLRNYDGIEILRKHTHYFEFLDKATATEKKYFVFAGIRNPLDEAVSLYLKYKSNHKEKYTDSRRLTRNGGTVTNRNLRRFHFIQDSDADFPTYFRKFHKLPYNNASSLSYPYCNFIIHFERLQNDFSEVLRLIGIEQKRPLPQVNKTQGKDKHFLSYYSPELTAQAKNVFGPFMNRWGYDFPPEWNIHSISVLSEIQFTLMGLLLAFYWKHVRWSSIFYGRLLRRLI